MIGLVSTREVILACPINSNFLFLARSVCCIVCIRTVLELALIANRTSSLFNPPMTAGTRRLKVTGFRLCWVAVVLSLLTSDQSDWAVQLQDRHCVCHFQEQEYH